MSEPFTHLAIERDDGVATLCLDRADKLNALNRALWHSIPEAVAALDRDRDVRAIVLTGKGKAFCAGIDLVDHAPALADAGSLSGIEGSAVAKRRQLYDDIRAYQRAPPVWPTRTSR
jgi:enoyl-CoA hydratase/carnithine racemase